MSQKRVRSVALVGLGSIGRRHLRLLKHLRPDIDVYLVRSGHGSPYPEEALAHSNVNSIDEVVMKNIDAAIISSPASYHVDQAIKFISSGIPLLIEKPLSHNLEKTQRLLDMATQNGVPVLVGYVLRHSSSLIQFHKLLADNAIGRVVDVNIQSGAYLPDWRPEQDYRKTVSALPELGGGVLLELSHEIDYANWLFGPFKTVEARVINSGTLNIAVEDIADLILTSNKESKVNIHLDFLSPKAIRQCLVNGSKGDLFWDGIENTVTLNLETGLKKHWPFLVERDHMFNSQLNNFLACLELDESPRVSLKDGIAALQIVEAAKRSQREGRPVNL